MSKIKIAFAAFAVAFVSLVSFAQTEIDVLINDADFKEEAIKQINALVADKDAGVTFTNTVAASVTNLSIVVIEGKVTSVTINGTTKP